MFSCVWLHFKKYFLMFGCVLENTIENTFCTCCSHFLIFSRLPNEYIISFIPQNTKKKPKKKKSSNPDTSRDRDWCEGEIAIGAVGASREASIAIEASRDRRGAGDVGGQYRQARLWTISTLSSFFLPLSLSLALSLSLSYFPRSKII